MSVRRAEARKPSKEPQLVKLSSREHVYNMASNVRRTTSDASHHRYTGLVEVSDRSEVISMVEEHMQDVEFAGSIMLETASVYGAVVAIPQIARCMDWNPTLSLLAFRSVLMLIINYILQVSAILLIGEASQVMDVLAGKMHLCDFGKNLENCPNDVGCLGPGGTRFTAPRLYSFDIWAVRNYVRDALIVLFPDQKEQIMANVDPGEYGMESYFGRFLACFLFMLVEVRDFGKIWDLVKLLYQVPSKAEEWISFDTDAFKNASKRERLETIRFQVAGMPIVWKVATVVLVILPKAFLWYSVCWIGVRWLMETSGILNAILGAITMDFVLTFDELLFDSLGNPSMKYIMDQITDYSLPTHDDPGENPKRRRYFRYVMLAIPRRLILTLAVLGIFIERYYLLNCKQGEDGTWVSQDMYLPKSSKFSFQDFVTNSIRQAAEPYWTMPDERPT